MNSQPPASPRPPRSFKPVFWTLAPILALFVALSAFALSSVDVFSLHFNYPSAERRYRSAGLPWTATELSGPFLPDDQNAAVVVKRLMEAYEELDVDQAPAIKRLWTMKDQAEVAAWLKPKEPILAALEPTRHLETQWNYDWDQGIYLPFPELAWLKDAVKLCCLRMQLKSAKGDVTGSLDDLELASSLMRVTDSPSLVHYLVRTAQRAILLNAVQKCASYHMDDPKALDAYAEGVSKLGPTPTLADAVKGEAYMGLAYLRNSTLIEAFQTFAGPGGFDEEPPDSYQNPQKLIRDGAPKRMINRSFAVTYLRIWAEMAEELKEAGALPEKVFEAAKRLEEKVEAEQGISATYTKVLFPISSQAALAGMKAVANDRATLSALKLASLRAAGAKLEKSQVSPVLLQDPFTQQPLKHRLQDDEILVWSVGEDGQDDDGITRADANLERKGVSASVQRQNQYDYPCRLPWKPSYSELAARSRP